MYINGCEVVKKLGCYMDNIFNKLKEDIKQGRKFLSFIGIKTIGEIFAFLVPLVLANFLKPDLFGSFSLFNMILFFGMSIFIGPVFAPFIIESNKEIKSTGKSKKTFTSVILYLISSISLFLIIFSFFGKEIIHFTGLDYDEYKWIFILAYIGLMIKSFYSALFLSQDKKNLHALTELIYPLVFITYFLFLYLSDCLFLKNIFLGYFISGILLLIICTFFVDYKRILPLTFSKSNFKEILHFGAWSALGYTSAYLINWGDNLVLRYFVSFEEIGIYNLAYLIFKGVITVSFMINAYYAPFVSRNIDNKKTMKDYLNKIPKILKFVLAGTLLAEILIGPFIKTFFVSEYFGAINLIRIFLIITPLLFYYNFFIPIYNSTKNYKINQIFLIVQVTLNIVFDIIFVYCFGYIGAAFGTVLAYVFFSIAYLSYYSMRIKPKLFS
jgi:O-antigen/teichoic acid export membrane protein